MRKTLQLTLITAFSLLLALPVLADGPRHYPRGQSQAQRTQAITRLRLGLFTPEGRSQFWDDTAIDFSGDPEGLEDLSWGVDFEWAIGPRASVTASTGIYDGSQPSSYLDFVDEFGDDIVHLSELKIAPVTLGLTLYPGGRDRSLNPYVGAGAGFYMWNYREVGDFIFDDDTIDYDVFESDGVATGYYTMVGLDLKIAPTMSVFAEARWTFVEDEMADQFDGLGTIDLSGRELSFGLAWRF